MADEMKKGQKYKIPGLILAVVVLVVVAICIFARPKGNPFQEYLDLGQKYLTEMNYEEAIVAFSKAIELDPRQAESYAGLAKAYAGLDDYENAIKTLEQGYEATGDEGLLLQKEQYERYLANQEIFQKLAALMEAYEESGDYNPVWDYMRQEEYQSVFDQLPEVLSYEAGHGKTLLVYPCGHCYYGSVEEGNRSGHGLWASFDYRGGWADFFDGSWEGDYPNGDGDFWLWDLHTPTIFLHHAGGFEDGKFAEKQEEDILEGVYHAIKGEDADKSMHQREFSREVMEEVQAKLDSAPQPEEGERTENPSGDDLTNQMRSLGEGYLYIYMRYPEQGTYMISYAGGDKGADVPYVIIDGEGNQILSGYEDAIWRTADGYARLLFCDPGSEEESANIYEIALGEMDGDIYLERYDWSGNLMEKQKMESQAGESYWDARNLYPEVSGEYVDYRGLFQEGNGDRNLSVSWEATDDGFLVYDQGGNQIGHIRIENPEEYQLVMVDDQLLGLGRPDDFSLQRLYAVGSGE